MGVYLNPGNGAFNIDLNGQIYVDKTGLIKFTNKRIDTPQRFIAVSRPRRFGKSMAANMLVAFYDKSCDSKKMFDGFEISAEDSYFEYLNKYNVIKLNIQNFLSENDNMNDLLSDIVNEVSSELSEEFHINDISENKGLARTLDKIYAKTGSKFIFIIDEWDCIFREKNYDDDTIKKYLDFLRDLLKDKTYVALAYLTGILPIKKYGTHSALNMFDEFSMINQGELARFTGFTDEEVFRYSEKYFVDFDKMQEWYDGYYLEGCGHIYNPRAVVGALSSRNFESFWSRTETYEALKKYIEMNMDGLKDAIIEMIAGSKLEIDTGKFQNDMTTFNNKDDILTLLVHLGYLAFEQKTNSVYIPNNEIRNEFKLAVEGAGWKEVADAISESEDLLKATWNKNEKAVAERIEKVHQEFTSILKYNNENSLTCVLSIAYYSAIKDYIRVYELPTGKGFADIAFIPRKNVDKPAIIIELKYNKDAIGAISQIEEKEYFDFFKDYKGNTLLVGVNYDSNSKKHSCCIRSW